MATPPDDPIARAWTVALRSQLDAVVARQQQQIDLLARELQRLREQQPEAAPLNERPPHY